MLHDPPNVTFALLHFFLFSWREVNTEEQRRQTQTKSEHVIRRLRGRGSNGDKHLWARTDYVRLWRSPSESGNRELSLGEKRTSRMLKDRRVSTTPSQGSDIHQKM